MQAARNWSDCLEFVAVTDVGMRRANNQDAHVEVLAPDIDSWLARGHLFAVCDGMGAHAAGELASEMAAEGIPHTYLKLRDYPAAEAIRKSIEDANAKIHHRGQANADFQGMGTTASALVLLPQGALVAHVGDSRVYRLRGTRLDQLTFDHSLVWEMSAAGQLPKDALPGFVPKNIITRSLGPHASVQVDLEGPFPLEAEDTFLLCSDGLTGQVCDEEIGVLLQSLPPADAAQVLIDLANLRGGPDNITVIIARVKGPTLTAAGGWQVEPLGVGVESETPTVVTKPTAPLWIAAAALLFLAVVLGAFSLTAAALVGLLLSLAAGLFAAIQQFAPIHREMRYLSHGARFGRGPHATVECVPNERFVNELISMIGQLREAATEEQWSIDWSKFNSLSEQAQHAQNDRDYLRAIREYATALRFLMNELRNQRARLKATAASAPHATEK